MNIQQYKELQDIFEELDHYEYTNEKLESPNYFIKDYLIQNNVQFEEDEKKGKTFFKLYYGNQVVANYSKGFYPNNAYIGLRIARNKVLADHYLELNRIPIPKLKSFKEKEKVAALNFVKSLENYAVIKPKNLSQSLGVYTSVNEHNFEEYWTKCLNIQKEHHLKQEVEIIIQEQIEGLELRVNVVEGKVLNVLAKLPWVLVGDGKKSIKDFIDDRNDEVKDNPSYKDLTIRINTDLKERIADSGKTLDSVLDEGELFMISRIPLNRLGSRKFNITHLLHPNILKLGVDAIKAIPGLHTGGIDMFIPSLDSDSGIILEVNKNPGANTSIYPIVGQSQNLLQEVIKDFMFEQKVLHEDIKNVDDLTNDDLKHLLKRYKFLYEKDKLNSRVITKLHHKYVEILK